MVVIIIVVGKDPIWKVLRPCEDEQRYTKTKADNRIFNNTPHRHIHKLWIGFRRQDILLYRNQDDECLQGILHKHHKGHLDLHDVLYVYVICRWLGPFSLCMYWNDYLSSFLYDRLYIFLWYPCDIFDLFFTEDNTEGTALTISIVINIAVLVLFLLAV
jgi:hypothetical protein